MDKYTYVLQPNRDNLNSFTHYYYEQELKLMTTFQLREICRREKIIQGVLDPLDKEELIAVIMRFRGIREKKLIQIHKKEGIDDLSAALRNVNLLYRTFPGSHIASKLIVYRGLSLNYYDNITIPYEEELAGTNAIVMSGNNNICGILNIVEKKGDREHLYIVKGAELECEESSIKNYSLYCFNQRDSERIYEMYMNEAGYLPEHLEVVQIPLLDFEVREPVELSMPVAIDFGSTNTTVGVYLDDTYFEKMGVEAQYKGLKPDTIHYTPFYEEQGKFLRQQSMIPSVVGVVSVEGEKCQYVYGYEAVKLANSSYIDEGFCVFYDIKRWVGDYEKKEEIIDKKGRRAFVSRRDILASFFEYLLMETKNRFKCRVEKVHISSPVKQKYLFQKMFHEVLPGYYINANEMLDEGVSVLYNTISNMIQEQKLLEHHEYQALIMDCGGGTTDLSACRFRIQNRRVSYKIDITTGYENGDTDFGGNNLTYRMMQMLKIAIINAIGIEEIKGLEQLLEQFDLDIFRFVDQYGKEKLYEDLEAEYDKAEQYIPTRFRDYEKGSRSDYYKVKNNYYYLFYLAEQIKKYFYNHAGVAGLWVGTIPNEKDRTDWLEADKWKLSVKTGYGLEIIKEFPNLHFHMRDMEAVLKGDIYDIVRKFMEPLYESGTVNSFSFIKLTGQSCKIDLFREALKEFIPGKMIQFKRRSGDQTNNLELKMTCVEGALKYLKDRIYGYADITVDNQRPVLPYCITAFTHTGEEVELVNGYNKEEVVNCISRNLENVTLQMFLKDGKGKNRYTYQYYCHPQNFEEVTYEEIEEQHPRRILQKETDTIVNQEVKFFVWTESDKWGFLVVPIFRKEERLYIGREQFYSFENDSWINNFFDGTK